MKAYIDRLERTRDLTDAEFRALLEESAPADRDYLFARARAVRESGRSGETAWACSAAASTARSE